MKYCTSPCFQKFVCRCGHDSWDENNPIKTPSCQKKKEQKFNLVKIIPFGHALVAGEKDSRTSFLHIEADVILKTAKKSRSNIEISLTVYLSNMLSFFFNWKLLYLPWRVYAYYNIITPKFNYQEHITSFSEGNLRGVSKACSPWRELTRNVIHKVNMGMKLSQSLLSGKNSHRLTMID